MAALIQRPQWRIGMALMASGRRGGRGGQARPGRRHDPEPFDDSDGPTPSRPDCAVVAWLAWHRPDPALTSADWRRGLRPPRVDDLAVRAVVDQGLQRLLHGVDAAGCSWPGCRCRPAAGRSGGRRIHDDLEACCRCWWSRRCSAGRVVGEVGDRAAARDGEQRCGLVRQREDLSSWPCRRSRTPCSALSGTPAGWCRSRRPPSCRQGCRAFVMPFGLPFFTSIAGAVVGVVDEADALLLALQRCRTCPT